MSHPSDEYALPLVHDPDSGTGSSFPGLDEAPTQVKPHAALLGTAPVPSAEFTPQILGARLDHFELLDSIGVGGMGRVFRARDTRLDRLVALKVLSPELSSDPEICRRFEQEAKAAARLDDRHFARVYFFGYDKGLRYIAMEYVEGENIRQKIQRQGRLSVAMALNVGVQIARGLSHAAACGVVHRDIKPSNIIMTPDGTAKLVDMGLARNFFQQSSPASELTQAGVTLGTFDYISPEQALDPRDADVRSDIYSLGCTLYHALTGRPPFSKGSALQKILQHQNDAVPDPRRFVPDLPEPVVAILVKMLEKEPKNRYQHPVEIVEDLRAVAMLLEVPLPDEQTAVNGGPRSRHLGERYLPWVLPVLLLILGVFAYAMLDRPTEPPATFGGIPLPVPEDHAVPIAVKIPDAKPVAQRPVASLESQGVEVAERDVEVASGEDLVAAVDAAPAGSVIKLTGKRYALTKSLPIQKNVRIESGVENGLTEVVVNASAFEKLPERAGSEVIRASDAVVEIRRIAWTLEAPNQGGEATFIHLLSGQLRMSECTMRAADEVRKGPVILARIDSPAGRRGGELSFDRCVITGADEVIRYTSGGNARIEILDCAIADAGPSAFRLHGFGDVELLIDHTTIRSADEPLFELSRLAGKRIQAQRSVFASARGPASSFEFREQPSGGGILDPWWRGRGNLYVGEGGLTISRDGVTLAENAREARSLGFDESGSSVMAKSDPVWLVDAATLNWNERSTADLLPTFRLRPEMRGRTDDPVGVRQTPWGPVYSLTVAEAASPTANSALEGR